MQFTPNSDLSAGKLYDLTLIDKMCRGNQEQVAKMVKVFVAIKRLDDFKLTSIYRKK